MFFSIAKIIKPHGVKGEIKALPFKPVFANLLINQKQFQIEEKTLAVSYIKEYKEGVIVKFAGVDDMAAAEQLRNDELMIKTKTVMAYLDREGIFFTEQWLGYRVEDENKNNLGSVEEILFTGANDVLVVMGLNEILVPVVPSFILAVDDDMSVITIVKPEYDK